MKTENTRRGYTQTVTYRSGANLTLHKGKTYYHVGLTPNLYGRLRSGFTRCPYIPQCRYAGYRGSLLAIPPLKHCGVTERGVRGFTLLEVLIVVLIIGVLAAVAVPQYQRAVLKSRYMQLEILGRAIFQAEQVYFLENGNYTENFEDLVLEIPGDLNKTKTRLGMPFGSCTLTSVYKELACNLINQNLQFFMYWRGQGQARCRCSNARSCEVCQSVCKRATKLEIPSGKTYVECQY